MNPEIVARLVPPLLAIQIAAFGWRINREIVVGEKELRTWLPLPDLLNIVSILTVVMFGIVVPFKTGIVPRASGVVVGVAYVVLAFHPITMAAHYRLFSRKGRSIYIEQNRDYPYATGQEIMCFIISLAAATGCAVALWR